MFSFLSDCFPDINYIGWQIIYITNLNIFQYVDDYKSCAEKPTNKFMVSPFYMSPFYMNSLCLFCFQNSRVNVYGFL